MAEVVWQVAERMRADLVAYAAPNLTGKRSAVRIFPRSRQGTFQAEDVRSLVIRAPHGIRVVLCTRAGDDWEEWPWRCVRMLPGHTLPSQRGNAGLPGVVLPDLDLLDPFGAKKTNPDLQSSFPLVERVADGEGWTFGRAGLPSLKGHVRMIRLEPDGASVELGTPEERLGRRILERAGERLGAAGVGAEALATLREVVADAVADALREGDASPRRAAAARERLLER